MSKDELICNCGTWATYGKKISKKAHSKWCEIIVGKEDKENKDKNTDKEQTDFLDQLYSINNPDGGWGDL